MPTKLITIHEVRERSRPARNPFNNSEGVPDLTKKPMLTVKDIAEQMSALYAPRIIPPDFKQAVGALRNRGAGTTITWATEPDNANPGSLIFIQSATGAHIHVKSGTWKEIRLAGKEGYLVHGAWTRHWPKNWRDMETHPKYEWNKGIALQVLIQISSTIVHLVLKPADRLGEDDLLQVVASGWS